MQTGVSVLRRRHLALSHLVLAAVLVALAVPSGGAAAPVASAVDATASRPAPAGRPAGAPLRTEKADASLAARVRAGGTVFVYARPGHALVARLGARTEFGSRQTLAIVARRGNWLGVVTPALPNGAIGWIDLRDGDVRLLRIDLTVTIDLSQRLLLVRQGGEVIRRATVGIGREGSPTPVGRFAVTDKLAGDRYGPYYGCCILALSAHQPNLPAGWKGGDRMAIHGTDDAASIGRQASAGCLRGRDAALRFLMKRLPLGTPVVIKA